MTAPASLFDVPGVTLRVVGYRKLSLKERRRQDDYRILPVFAVDSCPVCLGRGGTWADDVRVWTTCWNCGGTR